MSLVLESMTRVRKEVHKLYDGRIGTTGLYVFDGFKNRIMIRLFILSAVAAIFFACNNNTGTRAEAENANKVLRYGMVTGLKPEMIPKYKELHQNPWPGVLKKIQECNIRNYSIYLKQIEDKYYLFSYFEYTGAYFADDMQKMAADTTTQRWWKETDPCQVPLKEALEKHQVWSEMEQVFFMQ